MRRRWTMGVLLIPAILATRDLASGSDRVGMAPGDVQKRREFQTARLDSLQVVGQFEHAPFISVTFGDTDHDGANEIILLGTTPSIEGVLRILESQGNGEFAVAYEGPNLIPLAAGDVDQDGKSDLVVQVGARLFVYESEDEHSHPSNLVWQSAPISSGLGYDEIADTDSDGRLEIVHYFFAGEMRFVIFECQGDNTYIQKFLSPVQEPQHRSKNSAALQSIYNPWSGDDLIFDLDEDGRPEIVRGSLSGQLRIYESPADDVWELIYADSTGLSSVNIMSGGVDTDGDGKRELFIAGDDEITYDRTVFIYQPDGDRSFVRVGTLTAFDNATGPLSGAIAQLESEGKPRFIWQIYQQLRLYVANAPGEWVLESVIPSSATAPPTVYARDLNRNGRDEIYWISANRTVPSLILERPTLPTDVAGGVRQPITGSLRVSPSPCRSDATVFLDPAIASRAAEWSAFDAAGRLVFQQGIHHGAPREAWAIPVLRPGIYFLRVTDGLGRPLATGRATVIR